MSCDRIRPALSRMSEGEASPDEALEIGRHLAECTTCRILLARERRLADILENEMEDLPVGEEFVASVMKRVHSTPPADRPRRRRRLKLAALAAVGVGASMALARLSLVAGGFGLRASLAPAVGPGAIDAGLAYPGAFHYVRIGVDSALSLVPASMAADLPLAALTGAAVLGGCLVVACASTMLAVAAGSVLRLVR